MYQILLPNSLQGLHLKVPFVHKKKQFFASVSFKPRREKIVYWVSDQVQHKQGCTTTEDGYMLEMLNLGSKGTFCVAKTKSIT